MSRLEQFIRDNRESFDSDLPSKKVWDQLQQQTGEGNDRTQPIIWLSPGRWAVAVAISLLVAGGTWYLAAPSAQVTPAPRAGQAGHRDQTTTTGSSAQTASTGSSTQPAPTPSPAAGAQTSDPDPDPDALYREKMGYYAQLVRIKHRELGTLEKDEPLLYEQFTGDVKKLDSVYRDLEKQLPDNPNREQLLRGMLQALQLQMKLLNHQLDIIKKINHSKKTAYEQAYKTT